ncbi:MAG: hypothetical protein KDE27_33195 [Planctomycetes bacterium]|nr:hypothetical protein [Planctomycetota bacterium]
MRCLSTIVLPGVLLAQGGDPMRFVPSESEVIVRMRGPAAWQREFGSTGLAKAIASPALAPHWQNLLSALAHDAQLEAGAAERLAELPALLGGYDGEVALAVRIDWDQLDLEAETFAGAVVLAITIDESIDGVRLGERVAELLPPTSGEEIALGGTSVALRRAGSWQFAGPIENGGCLLVVGGSDLATQGPKFFEPRDADQPALEDQIRRATFGAQLATGRSFTRLAELADGKGGEAKWAALVGGLGLGAVVNMTWAMYPDGRFVGQSFGIDLDRAAGGLVADGLPTRGARPQLLRYVPPGAATYKVSSFVGRSLQDGYPRLVNFLAERLGTNREGLEQQFTAYTRLRLLEDVLALIGDEYLLLHDAAAAIAGADEDEPETMSKAEGKFGNSCLVLQVKDGDAVRKSLDTVIRARGLHVGRKSEEHAGTTIYALTLAGILPIEYAVTDSAFVIALSSTEASKRLLRGVLDAAARGGDEPFEFPAPVRERLEGLPENWSGIDVASLAEVVEGLVATIDQVEGALASADATATTDPFAALVALLRALGPELARQGASTTVSVDYYTRSRYLARTRW